MPTLVLLSALVLSGPDEGALGGRVEAPLISLFDFADVASVRPWRSVDDVVMGGVSSSRLHAAGKGRDGRAVFTGAVSLENNGGFASVRAAAELPQLLGFRGLQLRVRGDGQVYKIGLRTGGPPGTVTWQASFATTDTWTDVRLAFDDFLPTWRGRFVPDAGPWRFSEIASVGLSIADGQAGPFRVELRSIDAWADASDAEASASLAARIDASDDAAELLAALRWNARVIVVAVPVDLDAATSRQLGRLNARREDLVERDLVVLRLLGRHGWMAGRLLPAEWGGELRASLGIDQQFPMLALVGKDGGVKQRWSPPVRPEEIFTLIDAMPMRRREIAERR